MTKPPSGTVKKIRRALADAEDAKQDLAATEGLPDAKVRTGAIYYEPEDALRYFLSQIFRDLRLLAQSMGHLDCLDEIKTYVKTKGSTFGSVHYDHNYDHIVAPGLSEANDFFESLLASDTSAPSLEQGAAFENILRQTQTIVHKAKGAPKKEGDVKGPVFQVLKYAYPDTTRSHGIRHPGKNYVPDFASKTAQSGAEFKFAKSEAHLPAIYDQISGDMSGYKGDARIRVHFAVIYLAKAFSNQAAADAHFESVGKPDNWTIIVQNGSDKVKSARARKTTTKKAKKKFLNKSAAKKKGRRLGSPAK